MTIVLVHGIFNTGRVMSWMRNRFERQGYRCISPTIAPFDGRKGIAYGAQMLKAAIDAELGEDAPVVLIGFSMGGVVARYYLQCLGGDKRTRALFTISSPHNGSYMAYLPYPSQAFRELRPGSTLLNQLNQQQQGLADIPLYSFRTPLDFTIVPSRSSHWSIANNQVFKVPLHLSMIYSRRVVEALLTATEQLDLDKS
ncbi:alpha/beta fold hydrolase [Shewanella sp. Isolate11]|uniref:esterase/lipase family protein n=1 Tax=Shewanella sp. Isolate11 TaxID=2908530 RepID=UPI001EFE3F90|nr:alpha/beta fold hydrolase [Shewanella sp. Isolate11]MCG9698199.1 lipase [Shewanella sp. Isolate11]